MISTHYPSACYMMSAVLSTKTQSVYTFVGHSTQDKSEQELPNPFEDISVTPRQRSPEAGRET